MTTRSRRTLATALTALMLMAVWPGQRVDALGPSLMIFYGEPLKKPVQVSGPDAATFPDLLQSGSVTTAETSGRSYIAVALFWGPASNPANNGVPIDKLTPEMAWQHGRYFPPTPNQPALLVVTRLTKMVQAVPGREADGAFIWGGRVSDQSLAILKRLGIPTGPSK